MNRSCIVSLAFVSATIILLSPASVNAQTIPMLPATQAGGSNVCLSGEGNKVLTWDGASAIKCLPSVTVDASGNVNASKNLTISGGLSIAGNSVFGKDLQVNGNIGVGTASPKSRVHVDGDVMLGNAGETCNSDYEGALHYKKATHQMEYCNGTQWVSMGGVGKCYGLYFQSVQPLVLSLLTHDVLPAGVTANMIGTASVNGSTLRITCNKGYVRTGCTGGATGMKTLNESTAVPRPINNGCAGDGYSKQPILVLTTICCESK